MDLTLQDLITVEKNGTELEVYNHVTVSERHYVRPTNRE